MRSIAGQYASHQTWAADDRKKYETLKQRRSELMAMLDIRV